MTQLGYPIDERSDAQRARASASILGDVEYTAARVIARLTGERVYLYDDNSQDGMPDIRIEHHDGRISYAEVVVDIEHRYAETTSRLRAIGNGLPREIRVPELDRLWFLGLTGQARLATLDTRLPTVLHSLEQSGEAFQTLGGHYLATSDNPDLRRLHALGVADVSSRPPQAMDAEEDSGRVLMFAAGTSGPATLDWPAFIDWIDELLLSKKVELKRKKLARMGKPERHLFLGTSYTSSWAGFHPLSPDYIAVPDVPPSLPEEITHLWLMNIQTPGRCLVWYPDLGWRDTRKHWKTE